MASTQNLETLLTPAQFAQRFNVSERFLQHDRVTKRRIAFIRIGRFVRYRESDGIAYIEANRIGGETA